MSQLNIVHYLMSCGKLKNYMYVITMPIFYMYHEKFLIQNLIMYIVNRP